MLVFTTVLTFPSCSGNDDGSFNIWDLRQFKPDAAIAHFAWHKQQCTGASQRND